MQIAVTGSTGFIGQYLCPYLTRHLNANVIGIQRTVETSGFSSKCLALSSTDTELIAELANTTTCMIHLAARAHTQHASPLDFQRDNVALSLRIAKICIAAKIPRLIYISSIKVNGNSTQGRAPYSADEKPTPDDDYGQSKWDAELQLQQITAGSKTQLVIIRPPLVYAEDSANNKGNLHTLAKWADKGIPLPFARIQNKRDLVSLDNLCSLITLSVTHPAAANNVFLVSDGISRSTQDIVQLVSNRENGKHVFFSAPNWLLNMLKQFRPLRHKIESLTGDLQVDISKTKKHLNWKPYP